MTPKVSILIPVFNRRQFIAECIQSALDQTFADFEVVVVDNASDDGTWEICQHFALQDPRVRVFRNETNIGPVRNWLAGIGQSRGRYLKLLFSDDLIAPNAISTMLEAMQKHSADSALSTVLIGSKPWEGSQAYCLQSVDGVIDSGAYVRRYLFKRDMPVSPCAFLFDRRVYERELVNLVPTSPPEFVATGAGIDALSICRAVTAGRKVAFIHKPLTFFRHHGGSITVSQQPIVAEAYATAKLMVLKERYGTLAATAFRCARKFNRKLPKLKSKW